MAVSLPAIDRPPGLFTVPRLLALACLLALAIYLGQSGQGEAMARSVWAEMQFRKGMQEMGEGMVAQAVASLEGAAEASERYNIQFRVGIVYSMVGMQKRALPHLLEAVASHPRDANAFCELGKCLLGLGRDTEAVSAFEKALAVRPDDPMLMNDVGYSYADEGIRLEEAEELIERAAAMRPKEGLILDSLGWVYFRQGRWAEALAWLERAHRLLPDNPEIAAHLVQARRKVYSGDNLPGEQG